MSPQCLLDFPFNVDRIQPKITVDDVSIQNIPDFQSPASWKNSECLLFDNRGNSRINATFMVPSHIRSMITNVNFRMLLTHRKTKSGWIDIIVNGQMFNQSVAPPDQFQTESFTVSDSFDSILRKNQPNTITIQLSLLTQGNYNLSDFQVQFELPSGHLPANFGMKAAAYADITGVVAEDTSLTRLTQALWIVLDKDTSKFSGHFSLPSKYQTTSGT